MALDNYYNILGVAQNASAEDVQKAISEKRREWTPRTGHPKLETRQLAEQTIKNIAEAESILLDPAKRRDYDQQLAAQVAAPEPTQAGPTQGRDWLQIARDYLVQGNSSQANYAAREATTQQTENPEAWYIRGLSSELLGNNADAEFELSEAIRLNPNDASYHAELGDLYKNNELWNKALPEYTRASQLEPSNVYYSAFVGLSEGALGNIEKAHDLLKAAYEKLPDDETIRYFYGLALSDMITRTWSTYHDGSQSILTENQLNYSKEKLAIIDSLKITDVGFVNDLDEIRLNVERAELVKFWSFGGMGGLVFGEIVTIIAMFVFFGIGQGFVVLGILCLALAVLWVVLFVRSHRVPGWKWNWKQSPAYVRQTGLQ
ncbi:DnaJ domain-containing protein [Microbacterium sp. NPDC076895]|uniref:J domain-containing protein n=1 Tax=Microbacterium sp. NPDC076895 TaxID=3154957 RepID=UPI0034415F93